MFICDEMLAEASPTTAAARLAALACGSTLTRASHAAWDIGIKIGRTDHDAEAPRLVRVQCRGPAHMDATPLLILRWEADGSAQPFPVLDADITLVPDGDRRVLLVLAGVYRTPPETRLDYASARESAAVTARALLSRIAAAISGPVTTATQADVPGIPPGSLACTFPASP